MSELDAIDLDNLYFTKRQQNKARNQLNHRSFKGKVFGPSYLSKRRGDDFNNFVPCHFSLGRHVKDKIYTNKSTSIHDLTDGIREAIGAIKYPLSDFLLVLFAWS